MVIVEFTNPTALIDDFIEKKIDSKLSLIEYLESEDMEYTVTRLKESADYILVDGSHKGKYISVELPINELQSKSIGKSKFLESNNESLIDFLIENAVEFRVVKTSKDRKVFQSYNR